MTAQQLMQKIPTTRLDFPIELLEGPMSEADIIEYSVWAITLKLGMQCSRQICACSRPVQVIRVAH